jgi:hypothetical protein
MSASSQAPPYCNLVLSLIELSRKALDTLTHLDPWLVSRNGDNDLYMTSPNFTACRFFFRQKVGSASSSFHTHTHFPQYGNDRNRDISPPVSHDTVMLHCISEGSGFARLGSAFFSSNGNLNERRCIPLKTGWAPAFTF